MEKLEVKNPYSGQVVNTYNLESFSQVSEKVQLAKASQKTWSKKPLSQRLEAVQNALSYFEENQDLIAQDISWQMGRPVAQAKGEVNGLLERARYLCEVAEKTLSPDIIEDSDKFYRAIEHIPLGVVFILSAWNYPLLITINGVVPSLLAGNTVILKHSSTTPAIGEHFEKAFGDLAGVKHLVQNIIVDHETTGRVIEELPVNHVIFTGSVKGGQQILKHTSKRFMNPQLELGGKDGAYVAADADLDLAAATVVDGAMFNSGQSCCGIERAYVHESVFEDFLSRAKKLIKEYKLGDPAGEDTNLGPVAHSRSVDFMLGQIHEAESKGARVVVGGSDQVIGSARFMQPTLIENVNHDMDIMKEENFGPILPVMKVQNNDEAIALVNDSHYGLTCAIFTKDQSLAKRFAAETDTGTVFMNRCDYLDPALPWTGVRDSGVGSGLSHYSFYGVTRKKSVHFKK